MLIQGFGAIGGNLLLFKATGRLSGQTHRAGGIAFNSLAYGYEARGNIASVAETGLAARTRNYAYDELERLTNVASPSSPANDENYSYDAEGNRTASHLSAAHQTDAANRLRDDDLYSYAYDANGNLVAKAPKLPALSSWDYVYDALDELIEVRRDGVVVEEYRHDALGRRARIVTAGANDLAASLTDDAYGAKIERFLIVDIEAFDWNCPQHITPRYTMEEIEPMLTPLKRRIVELQSQMQNDAALTDLEERP